MVQQRDRSILLDIFKYRFLTTRHIHWLRFGRSSVRSAQRRLRQLWQNRFVDRLFLPHVLSAQSRSGGRARQPIYVLAKNGAEVVAHETGIPIDQIPHTPNRTTRGAYTLSHDLVANELLAAVEGAAIRETTDVRAIIEVEGQLRSKLIAARRRGLVRAGGVISDGAFTFASKGGDSLVFHIEVVRALAKRGNESIRDKMKRIVALHGRKHRFFAKAYGHAHLRAFLILTPTKKRARTLCAMASTLPSMNKLFWFSHYERTASMGIPDTIFSPDTVVDHAWSLADGSAASLRSCITSSHGTSG